MLPTHSMVPWFRAASRHSSGEKHKGHKEIKHVGESVPTDRSGSLVLGYFRRGFLGAHQ